MHIYFDIIEKFKFAKQYHAMGRKKYRNMSSERCGLRGIQVFNCLKNTRFFFDVYVERINVFRWDVSIAWIGGPDLITSHQIKVCYQHGYMCELQLM